SAVTTGGAAAANSPGRRASSLGTAATSADVQLRHLLFRSRSGSGMGTRVTRVGALVALSLALAGCALPVGHGQCVGLGSTNRGAALAVRPCEPLAAPAPAAGAPLRVGALRSALRALCGKGFPRRPYRECPPRRGRHEAG